MQPSCSSMKKWANAARNIPLRYVLARTGAKKDRYDKSRWITVKGNISITRCKFFNWTQNKGGGGAIDLAIHLNDFDFKQALYWLQKNFYCPPDIPTYNTCICRKDDRPDKANLEQQLVLPKRDDYKLPRVKQYLCNQRLLPEIMINSLIHSGRLYADNRQNALFLLLGKEKMPVGAELVGTGSIRWRGMAKGSQKNLGGFYVNNENPSHVILCESAIDAISCLVIHPKCLAISTSGLNPNPEWLPFIIEQKWPVFCGFDNDDAGQRMADEMMKLYPAIKRIKPDKKDWNDVLIRDHWKM